MNETNFTLPDAKPPSDPQPPAPEAKSKGADTGRPYRGAIGNWHKALMDVFGGSWFTNDKPLEDLPVGTICASEMLDIEVYMSIVVFPEERVQLMHISGGTFSIPGKREAGFRGACYSNGVGFVPKYILK